MNKGVLKKLEATSSLVGCHIRCNQAVLMFCHNCNKADPGCIKAVLRLNYVVLRLYLG